MLIGGLVRKAAALGRSVVGRLILIALSLVALSALARTFVLTDMLRHDVHAFAASQQLALTEMVAQNLAGKLRDRQAVLAHLAGRVGPATLGSSADLQRFLDAREAGAYYFPAGMAVLDGAGGHALAATGENRALWNEAGGQEWFTAARRGGTVVRAVQAGPGGEPVAVLAVPMRDGAGTVAAVLAGAIPIRGYALLAPLDRASATAAGTLVLVIPDIATLVSGTEASRTLAPFPVAGADGVFDGALGGFRGSREQADELASVAAVPGTGWLAITRLPTEQAFAVLHRLRGFILRNSALSGLAVVLIIAIVLPYLFRPLSSAARQMRAMAEGRAPLHPLPVVRADEIGEMVAGFNYLLERLKANEERMAHMAHHDALTGLPNRALFEDRLDQAFLHAERQGRGFALLFLDLDGFKPINDSHGHDVGDVVLRQVAGRLKGSVRRGDTVARYGGDEFVVILPDLDDPGAAAAALSGKLRAAVSAPYQVNGLTLALGLSVGIAVYPGDGADAASLIANADQAMYRAKRARRV